MRREGLLIAGRRSGSRDVVGGLALASQLLEEAEALLEEHRAGLLLGIALGPGAPPERGVGPRAVHGVDGAGGLGKEGLRLGRPRLHLEEQPGEEGGRVVAPSDGAQVVGRPGLGGDAPDEARGPPLGDGLPLELRREGVGGAVQRRPPPEPHVQDGVAERGLLAAGGAEVAGDGLDDGGLGLLAVRGLAEVHRHLVVADGSERALLGLDRAVGAEGDDPRAVRPPLAGVERLERAGIEHAAPLGVAERGRVDVAEEPAGDRRRRELGQRHGRVRAARLVEIRVEEAEGGELAPERGEVGERGGAHVLPGEGPADEPEDGRAAALEDLGAPAAPGPEQREGLGVEEAGQAAQRVEVVVAGHGEGADAGRREALGAPHQRPEGLEDLVVLVGHVAGEDDRVDGLLDGLLDGALPRLLDAEGALLRRHVRGEAPQVEVAGAEEAGARSGHGRRI